MFQCGGHPKRLTYDELEKIEVARDRVRLSAYDKGISLLGHWQGTILRCVVLAPDVWFSLAVYVVVKYCMEAGILDPSEVPLSYLGIVGGFISFLLVFFIGECYSRYMNQFGRLAGCFGRIFDCAALAGAILPKPRASRLLRYMNTAVIVGVSALSDVYDEENFFIPLIKNHKLLTDKELDEILAIGVDTNGGVAFKHVITWCMKVVAESKRAGEISDMEKNLFDTEVLRLRGTFGDLFDYQEVSVPFIYVNWVQIMNMMYCPLFAAAVAISSNGLDAEEVGFLVVVLNNLFINGLYALARIFQDPFGSDMEDLSVLGGVIGAIKASRNNISQAELHEVTAAEEAELLVWGDSPKAVDDDGGKGDALSSPTKVAPEPVPEA